MTQREKYKKKTYENKKNVNYDWSRMKNATDLNELIHVVNKASWPFIVIFGNISRSNC